MVIYEIKDDDPSKVEKIIVYIKDKYFLIEYPCSSYDTDYWFIWYLQPYNENKMRICTCRYSGIFDFDELEYIKKICVKAIKDAGKGDISSEIVFG